MKYIDKNYLIGLHLRGRQRDVLQEYERPPLDPK